MKTLQELVNERLKISNRIECLGDKYFIGSCDTSVTFDKEIDRCLHCIDYFFGISKLKEVAPRFRDFYSVYDDNKPLKMENEEVRELFKIILNILFSSESDLDKGLEILIDACKIPEDKAKRLYINKARQYSKYDELKFDQGLILHIEYWERKNN